MLQLHISVANLRAVIRKQKKKVRVPVQLPEKRILIKYIHLHRAESFLDAITEKNKIIKNSLHSTKSTRDTKSTGTKRRFSVGI